MNYWDFKRPNARRYRQAEDTDNDVVLFLVFGRDFYDKVYGLDLQRVGETYLEYTYNLKEGTAEYFKANDHDIRLYGWQWMGEGVPDFQGYMRSRQLAYWTTAAANNIKEVKIPIGNPIRRIGVQACTRAYTLSTTFSEIELRVNNGEYSPVLVKAPMRWVMQEVAEYGLHNVVGGIDYLVGTSEIDLPYWWSYIESVEASPYAYAGEMNLEVHGITIPARIRANTTGNQEASFVTRGWGFQKALRIGFDHEYDGSDLLQSRGMGALDLVLTEAVASAEARVFVQDIMSY